MLDHRSVNPCRTIVGTLQTTDKLNSADYVKVPFVIAIVVTLLFSSYMLFDPAQWLVSFMQLTDLALDFRVFILILGIGYFVLAWVAEKYLLPRLVKLIGRAKESMTGKKKEKKMYKMIQEEMRIEVSYVPT